MSTHTPGPWQVQEPFSGMPSRYLVVSERGVVCDVGLNCGPQPHNARLIAAAPDLLAACQQLVETLNDDLTQEACAAWDTARAAIAKADGQ